MGAFLKQLATLVAGNMAGSNNKAKFIVKTGRATYIVTGTTIAVVWYSAWRNERVDPGEAKFPVPGLQNLKRKNQPDRPEKEFTHAKKNTPSETWGNSQGQAGKNKHQISTVPSLLGIPQTPADAKKYRGLGSFEGKPVAMWILPYLNYARAHGWRGTLNQGWRTYAEEVQIAREGIYPHATPGTSNHGKKNFPGGAIDVTEAEQLNTILKSIPGGSLLIWAGGKDPVHFSHPHNGGY